MTSPFTDFCIHCDQLIDKNENVLYYTRTTTELEKFHKQLYCSDSCKKEDEQMKLMLLRKTSQHQTQTPLLFKYLPPAVNNIIGSPAYRTLSKLSSENNKEDKYENVRCPSPMTSPFLDHIEGKKENEKHIGSKAEILVSDFYSELKKTHQNLNPGKENQSLNFFTDVYCEGKNNTEKMAEKNYTLWLNSMTK